MTDRVLHRNDFRQREERRLHQHVDATAQTDLARDRRRVHDVKFRVLLGEFAFQERRQFRLDFFRRPCAVQKEGAALFQTAQ